jgi:hypothetical protein
MTCCTNMSNQPLADKRSKLPTLHKRLNEIPKSFPLVAMCHQHSYTVYQLPSIVLEEMSSIMPEIGV